MCWRERVNTVSCIRVGYFKVSSRKVCLVVLLPRLRFGNYTRFVEEGVEVEEMMIDDEMVVDVVFWGLDRD